MVNGHRYAATQIQPSRMTSDELHTLELTPPCLELRESDPSSSIAGDAAGGVSFLTCKWNASIQCLMYSMLLGEAMARGN